MGSSLTKIRMSAQIGIAICLLLTLRATGRNTAPESAEATEAEYEVFSTYIGRSFVGAVGKDRVGDRVSQIVLVNRTESDEADLTDEDMPPRERERHLRKEVPSLSNATISNFHWANIKQAQLGLHFHLPVWYQLISAEKVGSILKDVSSWPEYYKQYPGAQGYMALSRVGFSPHENQALFYASNRCGGKCATGSYVVMEKHGSVWKIVKEVFIWMS